MEKVIYQDQDGLYYVEMNENNEPIKVYCDEYGNPLLASAVEIYQQADGAYYYVEQNAVGEAYKVYCDANGNPIDMYAGASTFANQSAGTTTYGAPVTAGLGAAGLGAAALTKPKKKTWLIVLLSILGLLFISGAGYFAYSKFFSSPTVDVSNYEVEFKAIGNNGEAKAKAEITRIPVASNVRDAASQDAIDELLKNADISYSKAEGLSNDDSVEVKVRIDEDKAKEYNLAIKGKFAKSFKVSGLTEKSKDSDSKDKEDKKDSDSKSSSKFIENSGTRYVRPGVGVNLRSEPNDSSHIITAIPNSRSVYQEGTLVNSNGEQWSKVNYGGRDGWIRTDLLS